MVDYSRDNTLPRDIVDEMRESYLNYSMSVIVSRALPDAVSYTHLTLPTKA